MTMSVSNKSILPVRLRHTSSEGGAEMPRARSLGLLLVLFVAASTAIAGSSIAAAAKAGWAGERIVSSPAIGNGWEPAVASAG